MVVVAVGELVGRDRIVLVDDRDRAELKQAAQRRAGVEVAAADDEVVLAEQQLRAGQAVLVEHLLVGVHERTLPGGSSGLQRRRVRRTLREPEATHPCGDRAGGHHDDLHALRAQASDLRGQRADLRRIEVPVRVAQ
jgi:hypothetical protein